MSALAVLWPGVELLALCLLAVVTLTLSAWVLPGRHERRIAAENKSRRLVQWGDDLGERQKLVWCPAARVAYWLGDPDGFWHGSCLSRHQTITEVTAHDVRRVS